MFDEPETWFASLLVGLAVVLAVYAGRDYVVLGLGAVERDITEKLRRLRAPTRRVRAYLMCWLGLIGVTFFGLWFLADNPVFAILFSVFLLAFPWYLLRRMARRHREKIEDQLADSMVTLANAVRAGLSLVQSLEILAAQCPRPINAEFHQIVAEYKLGKTLERTLIEAKQRLKSENFALFAAALLASHESGGRLNETVERIAQSVLELQPSSVRCSRRRPKPASRPCTWPWRRPSSWWPTTSWTRSTRRCSSPRWSASSCWRPRWSST